MKEEAHEAIAALQARKVRLEQDILQSINRLVNEFEDETGVSLDGVSVEMVDITGFGDKLRKCVIVGVTADLSL